MRQAYIAFTLAVALSVIATGMAAAQGKSGQGKGRAVGNPHSSDVASGSPKTNSSRSSDDGGNLGFDSAGTYGQLGTSYSTPVGESMFLQLYGGVDLDQQTSTDPAGDATGRVGLGWKF